MNDILWIVIETSIKAIVIISLLLFSAAISVYLERKISAWMQNRIGPNRVGPFGFFQPFADVFKLFMKEDIIPDGANKFFHGVAPMITLGIAISVYAVIPFGDPINIGGRVIQMGIAPQADIGILLVLALTSVGVFGIALAGWSSNNKYSLLGGIRSTAQMISYELSMGLAILAVIVVAGSFSLSDIVTDQYSHWNGFRWNIFIQPLGFIIFFVTGLAETNRAPFDLPEAEQELVSGYNTEYSGMRFGMFFLAEYANMATSAAIITLLFLGGWTLPFNPELIGLSVGSWQLGAFQFLVFVIKIYLLICTMIWIRWTLPRFRYDQLMNLGWKVLLPLALVNFLISGLVVLLIK
jgi:NADH-quinone oxidoreductase subunit H